MKDCKIKTTKQDIMKKAPVIDFIGAFFVRINIFYNLLYIFQLNPWLLLQDTVYLYYTKTEKQRYYEQLSKNNNSSIRLTNRNDC